MQITVTINNFHRIKQETGGNALLTAEQSIWLTIQVQCSFEDSVYC